MSTLKRKPSGREFARLAATILHVLMGATYGVLAMCALAKCKYGPIVCYFALGLLGLSLAVPPLFRYFRRDRPDGLPKQGQQFVQPAAPGRVGIAEAPSPSSPTEETITISGRKYRTRTTPHSPYSTWADVTHEEVR